MPLRIVKATARRRGPVHSPRLVELRGMGRTRQGGGIGYRVNQGGAAQIKRVGDRFGAFRGIEDQLHPAGFHGVDDVGTALANLVDPFDGNALIRKVIRGPAGRQD